MARHRIGIAAFACIALLGASGAEETHYEMATLQFVLLHRPADAVPVDREESARIQAAHLDFLQSLADDGTALIMGPLPDAGNLRGVVVLAVESAEDAERILAGDPWVRQGSLKPEIHTWWAAKGILQSAKEITDAKEAYLGLLQRPDDAPELGEDDLREIQRGHLGNIQAMADEGALVIAGPTADDGKLRGILVFRETDPDRIRELVARDPAIQKRRLELDLHRWLVPKEAFP